MQEQGVPAYKLALVGAAAIAYAFFGESWGFDEYGTARVITDMVGGLSFVVAGLVAWHHRPENRMGPYMIFVGSICWFTVNLRFADDNPPLYTIGIFALGPAFAVAMITILAFPDGRLLDRTSRLGALGAVLVLGVGYWLRMLFFDPLNHDCKDCGPSDNLLLVTRDRALDDALEWIWGGLALLLTLGLAAVFIRRYRQTSRAGRRVYGPVFATSIVAVAWIGINEAFVSTVEQDFSLLGDISWAIFIVTSALIPAGLLLGVLRTRAGRSPLSDLIVRLHEVPTGGALRDLLAEALGDPGLRIGLWVPALNAYVDEQGNPIEVQGTSTAVPGRDGPLAVLLHDPALLADERMLAATVAAARFALENERLQAEVRAQLAEVRASRARIVQAGDEQRRRIERDLHDGAQQRLVSMALGLQLLRDQMGDEADPGLRELLAAVTDEAKGAVTELRELAQGIHPAILTDEGLGGALRSLAERSVVPVRLENELNGQRLPQAVEAAGYFACAESLTNAAKHASATEVAVRAAVEEDCLRLQVSDDGVGGADLGGGTGLRGVGDRVLALGGRMEIDSRPGEGTCVSFRIPIEDGG